VKAGELAFVPYLQRIAATDAEESYWMNAPMILKTVSKK